MFDLVQAVTTPVHTGWNAEHEGYLLECKDTRSGYDGTRFVSADCETRKRLNDLDAAVRNALADAYAEGKARGQRSLLQLASGEMSPNDFEKRSIRRQHDE